MKGKEIMILGVSSGSQLDSQVLPVTTESAEARKYFEAGRNAAFHWNASDAQK